MILAWTSWQSCGVRGEHLAGDLGVAGLVGADEAELVAAEVGARGRRAGGRAPTAKRTTNSHGEAKAGRRADGGARRRAGVGGVSRRGGGAPELRVGRFGQCVSRRVWVSQGASECHG